MSTDKTKNEFLNRLDDGEDARSIILDMYSIIQSLSKKDNPLFLYSEPSDEVFICLNEV